jgi:hypothetical protein
MAIRYSLWSLGTLFLVLVCFTKKNQATLGSNSTTFKHRDLPVWSAAYFQANPAAREVLKNVWV